MVFLYVFLVGLCIGSFVNVLLVRLGKKGGIFLGRSECPHCSAVLKWYDLIPVLSFILLKGRCRNCKKKISKIYPLVEIATACLSLFTVFKIGALSWFFLFNGLIISLFFVLVLFDILYRTLPNKIVLLLLLAVLAKDFIFGWSNIKNLLFTALILGAFFAIMYLASRGRWLGFGDVKLVFIIGLLFGYPFGYLAITAAVWLAALIGIALMAANKAGLKTALPFGAFMAGASIAFIIFQNEIQLFRFFF